MAHKGGKHALAQGLFVSSLLFLGLALFSLGWTVWPAPTEAVQISIPAGPLPGAPADSAFASLAEYTLSVEWPSWIRKGQKGMTFVRMAQSAEGQTNREAQIVLVEPIIPGLPIEPKGQLQTSLAEGQELDLGWDLTGLQVGEYPGKVMISFGFYDEALGEIVATPVAVTDVIVRVTALWGLPASLTLWLGLVGLALWGALFLLGRVVEARGIEARERRK